MKRRGYAHNSLLDKSLAAGQKAMQAIFIDDLQTPKNSTAKEV
jgi:hypothetical protein